MGYKSHNFSHWLSAKLKKIWKGFFKDPESIYRKSGLSSREDYIAMFVS